MESNIKSSFIPRDTAAPAAGRPYGGSSGGGIFDLLMLVAIVFLVASIALGIGVFLYLQYLQTSLDSKKEQITRAEAAFEPTLIAELTRLDDRMKSAQTILEKHIAPSVLFNLLEDLTLETVSFSDFSFDATQGDAIKVTMKGTAESVNSIALQADLLAKHQAFSSPIFSNINRDRDFVRFDLAMDINPAVLRYVNALRPTVEQVQTTSPNTTQTQEQVQPFNAGGETTGAAQEEVLPVAPEAPDSIPNFAP